MALYPRSWVEIDLPALRHNLGLLRLALGDAEVKIALVAKADAYGHGLIRVSQFATKNGADWIAVATIVEGVALREAGISCPIIVISPTLPEEAQIAVDHDLRVLVQHPSMIQALGVAAVALGKKATVHMEIDTGLGRFGFMREQAVHRAKLILGTPGLHLEGISTHFANSSGDPSGTDTQVHRFQEVLSDLRKEGIEFEITHMANSAGAVRYPEARGNLVRSGIGVYGMDPYDLFEGEERPVMRWYARIMVMRDLKPGARVSYNGTYETKGDERIATLGIGYGDGYDRALSNRGSVWVNGQRAPVVGLVCMDQMMVNVTGIEGVKEGDVVEVAGEHVPIKELAALAETNPHEITCRITARTPRHYLEG